MTAALLSAEITARCGRDPGALYRTLVHELGEPFADRVEAPATREQAKLLSAIKPSDLSATELAGETIDAITTTA